MARLQLTSDANADALLSEDPFALLVGMLLDQQIAMEVAFAGPRKIADRLGGLDARLIAEADPEAFAALCAQTPAVHRFPASMAKRIQELARAIVGGYDGDAAAVWNSGDPDAAEVLRRLKALPGFGEQKARIFLALLGKQYGVTAGLAGGGRRLWQGRHSHVDRRRGRYGVIGPGSGVQKEDEGGQGCCREDLRNGRPAVKTHLNCPCGEAIRGQDEDELVELALAHLAEAHPGMEYEREHILFMAY